MKKKEKKLQKVTKHFKKEKRECPNCHKVVDAYVKRCPHCYERLADSVIPERYQNMVFLTDYKLLLIFLVGTAGMMLFTLLITLALDSIPTDANLKANLYSLIPCLLSLSVIACILSYDIKDVFNSFKKTIYHLRPIIASLIGLAIIVGFSYAYQGIFKLCGHPISDSGNQTSIVNICRSWPALAFFYVVLFGPLLEELTYRLGLFTVLRKRNRILAYVVSVLLFAFMHIIFGLVSGNAVNELINLPLYIVPAFVLTALYENEGIASSTYAHILNNLISFIIILTVR